MRTLAGSILVTLALALAAPPAMGQAAASTPPRGSAEAKPSAGRHHHAPAPVSMKVSAGYGDQYRSSAWTPVRVTLHNRTDQVITGTVEVPEPNTFNNMGPPQPFHALYQTPVTLPAGATKLVTLYIPGYDLESEAVVSLRSGGRTLAQASDYPTDFGTSTFTIGALAADPADTAWLNTINPRSLTTNEVSLSFATLDPVPEALASFDVIALTDADTSRLDRDQLTALEQYVHNGGTLLLVGGPNWQETLRPLPAGLLPGAKIAGSRTLPDLRGLLAADPISTNAGKKPAAQATTVSVLAQPRGTVVAGQAGVPLAVRMALGQGTIEYLAFDPAVDPVRHWAGAPDLLGQLVASAAPAAASRSTAPGGPVAPPFYSPFGPPMDIGAELANVPAAALPSLLLFVILTALYILLLGPANFLVLRRMKRRELTWITVPVLALVCVGSTFGVAYHLKGSTVLLNTVGFVTLDGSGGPHPAALYVGLFAPVRGDYQLTYDAPALPATVPQFTFYGPGPPPSHNPLGLRLQEGAQTGVTFLSMNMWSMRDVALHTTVNVPGRVESNLRVDARGDIVGTITNGTSITLRHPAIMAGRGVAKLRDIPAGGTIRVRVRPSNSVFNQDQSPVAFRLYGQPQYGGPYGYPYYGKSIGGVVINLGSNAQCCGPPQPVEKTTTDHLRNVAMMIPEAQSLSTVGEVFLVGWSENPLGSLTVDGTAPQRRDLNLIAAPLSVHLPARGAFQLRQGTLGAHLVDDVPVSPSNYCCGPVYPPGQQINLGSGGSATFEFDLPNPGHLHFRRLTLWVNAGGADGTDLGSVYDWKARRWVHVDLSLGSAELRDPSRFISPAGALRLNLKATDTSGDIRIQNPLQSLQISGSGVVT